MMPTLTKDPDTEDTGKEQSADGVERLLTKVRQRSFPDRSGRSLGVAWAAWKTQGGYKVYVMDRTGDLMRRPDLRRNRHRRYRFHRAEDEDALWRLLARLRHRALDPTHPLEELQQYIRRKTNDKCRHLQYEQRHHAWIEKQTVRTERRPGGGTMNWIE